MIDVSAEIDINCSRDKVAEYSANPDNAPKWYVNIQAAKWKTPRPLKVGSQIVFKTRFLGKARVYIYEISEYAAEQKMVMKTLMSPFHMYTLRTKACGFSDLNPCLANTNETSVEPKRTRFPMISTD